MTGRWLPRKQFEAEDVQKEKARDKLQEQDNADAVAHIWLDKTISYTPKFRDQALKESPADMLALLERDPKSTWIVDRDARIRYHKPDEEMEVQRERVRYGFP